MTPKKTPFRPSHLAAALAGVVLAGATLSGAPAVAGPKGGHGCPPGLAKKSPACVPPGLAKKGVTSWKGGDHEGDDEGEHYASRDDREDHEGDRYRSRYDRYRPGDRLSPGEYVVLKTGDRVTFNGQEYTVIQTDQGTILKRGDQWYRLPRTADTSEYVRIGDALVKLDGKTGQVIELMRLADLILN